jgi:hypothetical protein
LLTEPTPEATPTRRKLLNVTTQKIIKVDLPELDGHAVLPSPDAASEGMLVVREKTLVMCLLSHLTRHVFDLPTLVCRDRDLCRVPDCFLLERRNRAHLYALEPLT